jgi:hypothetical protein
MTHDPGDAGFWGSTSMDIRSFRATEMAPDGLFDTITPKGSYFTAAGVGRMDAEQAELPHGSRHLFTMLMERCEASACWAKECAFVEVASVAMAAKIVGQNLADGKHLATAVGDFRVRVDDDGSNGEFAGDPVRDLQSWTGCIWISPDCRPYVAPIGGSGDLCNLSATFHGNSSSMRLTLWSAM